MLGMKLIPEMSIFSQLTRLIAGEDFINSNKPSGFIKTMLLSI
jgi:hypothetical protein